MDWLADTARRRSVPFALWPEVRSVVMLGMNYGPQGDPLATLAQRSRGTISVYARNRDYHDLIKGALKRIATTFAARAGADVKVFVDTAPVMEKPLAEAAGIGWQGKHTNLVSREFGSWLFLGAIFTTAKLSSDSPEADHCGSCRACLDICPTNAFPAPYRLDARRCISYLTIEHHGPIDRDLRPLIGRKLFVGSPIKRIGRDRFVRNVLIAIGNSENETLVPDAERLIDDSAPEVRGAAIWALQRLAPARVFELAATKGAWERHPDVQDEWAAATERAAA
jgi:epoxyqueuosine reductase